MNRTSVVKKWMATILCVSLLTACSNAESNEGIENVETPSRMIEEVLLPNADGTSAQSDDVVIVDYSHTDQGYIMAKTLHTDHNKIKLQLIHEEETYTYDLNDGDYTTYPFNMGDGSYQIRVLEQVEGDSYYLRYSLDVDVTLENEFVPFLYPNQIVDYDLDTLCVTKSFELVQGLKTDLDRVSTIYTWVIENVTYDYDKVEDVQGKYVLPVLDETYTKQKGICFDYAALMAAMLRVQHIPTKVVTGMVDEGYHAWIEVYIENMGWIKPHIYFESGEWTGMDPTYDASNKDYDGTYTTKYTY